MRACVAASAVALLAPGAAWAQTTSHVAVLHADPALYDANGWDARAALARSFLATRADGYDFLVVFPAFPIALSTQGEGETLGKHWDVRNDVEGIGLPRTDSGAQCGSARRLKGIIDVHSLVPGVDAPGPEVALGVVAHEIAHQWSGRVRFLDPSTDSPSTALLGRDGAHWSYFLDSDASVLYGADWRDAGGGQFVADASRKRYSALDLYLMGIFDPSEVPTLSLLVPGAGAPSATALPPADGTFIAATAFDVPLSRIIAMEGRRVPDKAAAQKAFRAAFVLVVPDGVDPTADQLALVDQVRRDWATRFFFMTHGRGTMETDLVEVPPRGTADTPSLAAALGWLLASQRPDGGWADDPATQPRDTQAALEALRLYQGDPRAVAALGRGGASLQQTSADSDTWARTVLAARAASVEAPRGAAPRRNGDGGYGLAGGYGSTVIDTALVGLAARALDPGADVEALADWMLAMQHGDGGWSFVGDGPSSVRGTAIALEFLARADHTARRKAAAEAALVFLEAAQRPGWTYGDEYGTPAETAVALLAMDAWGATRASEQSIQALLALQAPDGSWGASAHETALVLHTIRLFQSQNLSVSADTAYAVPWAVTEGQHAVVNVTVFNTGRLASRPTKVGVYAADGALLSPLQDLPEFMGSWPLAFDVDTAGLAGATQVFIVVDPAGTLDETTKADNRAAVALEVGVPPAGADPYADGPIAFDPRAVSRLPSQLAVTALVGNCGRTDVVADVAMYVGDVRASTTRVSLPAGARIPVTLSAEIGSAAIRAPVAVVVDPDVVGPDANRANNRVSAVIPVSPTMDPAAVAVAATPDVVEQGRDLQLVYTVANRGTIDAIGVPVRVRILDAAGASVAVAASTTTDLPGGSSRTYRAPWRATAAGTFTVSLEVAAGAGGGNADGTNDRATATARVTPSTTPNFAFVGEPLVSPDPPLAGKQATVRATVVNRGGGAAGPFAAELRVGPRDGVAAVIQRVTLPGLAPNGTSELTGTFTPSDGSPLSVVAVADPDQQVSELDELDNVAARTVEPLPIADLVIADADLTTDPAFPKPGATVAVSVSVYNAGGQPSTEAPVELWIGDPGSGVLIGSATIPALPARTRTVVPFTWSTQGLSGTQLLVAAVNRSRTAAEQRYDNDTARRTVVLQSGSVVVSNPYFSPNGDGVKDTTEIVWSAVGEAAREMRFEAKSGDVVRTVPLSGTTSFQWDGRSDAGALVRDGSYRVLVAGNAGVHLGAATVVVDTNGMRLQDPEAAALVRNIDLRWPENAHGYHALTILPDDKTALVATSWEGTHSDRYRQFYRQSVLGGPLEPVPVAWPPAGDALLPDYTGLLNLEALDGDPWWRQERIALSPDGTQVALAGRTPARWCTDLEPCRYPFPWQDYSAPPMDEGEPRVVLLDLVKGTYDALASAEDEDHSPINVQFTPDGRRILFGSLAPPAPCSYCGRAPEPYPTSSPPSFSRIYSVAAVAGATQPVRLVEAELPGPISWFRVSPDGSRIGTISAEGFSIVQLDGTSIARVVVPFQRLQAANRLEWLPDGEHVVLFGTGTASIAIVDVAQGDLVAQPILGSGYSLALSAIAPAAASDVVAFAFNDGLLQIADPPGSEPRAFGSASPAFAVALSPRSTAAIVEGQGWGGLGHGRSLVTFANLTAILRASRPAGGTAVGFRGTAMDLNLDAWEISVRPHRSTDAPVVVARSSTSVIDGALASWQPPAPGLYEATLTVRDLAGNVGTARTLVPWDQASLIANLRAEPMLFSPNGDGRQDSTAISYTAVAPVSAQLEIASGSGAVVRRVDRGHAEPGDFTYIWDGLDDQGVPVDDGAYQVRLEGASAAVAIDTTPPRVTFSIASQPLDDVGLRYEDAVRGATVVETGEAVQYRGVDAFLSWNTVETNLDWVSPEIVDGEGNAESLGIIDRDGSSGVSVPAASLAGVAARARARDRAGNEGLSSALSVREEMFLTGLGELDSASGSLRRPDGTIAPRLDLLTGMVRKIWTNNSETFVKIEAHSAAPVVFRPARWTFSYEGTVAAPIAFWGVQHDDALDFAHVAEVAPGVVVWDATAVPATTGRVHVFATDVHGRTFGWDVPFTFRRDASIAACVRMDRQERTRALVSLSVFDPDLDALAPGAVISFRPLGQTAAALTAPVTLDAPSGTANTVTYATEVATSELSECEYMLQVDGRTTGGVDVFGRTRVDLCGMVRVRTYRSQGRVLLEAGETWRPTIRSLDVLVRTAGNAYRLDTTAPGFEGRATIPLSTSTCPVPELQLVPTLADGRRIEANSPYFHACPLPAGESCGEINARVTPGPAAPECSPNVPTYELRAAGGVDAPPPFTSLVASIVTLDGTVVTTTAPSSFTPGQTFEVTSPVQTASLKEGAYRVRVAAARSGFDAEPETLVADTPAPDADPTQVIWVDRTLPVLGVASPIPGARLCPALGPGNEWGFPVDYSVSDDFLTSFSLKVRPVGTGAWSSIVVIGGGEAAATSKPRARHVADRAWIPKRALPPGDYELAAVAYDASRGSACVPSRRFSVKDSAVLVGAAPAPSALAASANGIASGTFRIQVQGGGTLVARTTLPDGAVTQLLSAPVVDGMNEVGWSASLPDGSYDVALELTDECGAVSRATAVVEVDTTPPVARIDAPAPGAAVGASIAIQGEASDAHLASWQLELGPGLTPESFGVVASGTASVAGLVAVVSTAALPAGAYTLRLVANDAGGRTSTGVTTVQVVERQLLAGVSLAPPLISPNGDGTLDAASGVVMLLADAGLSLVLTGPGGTAAIASAGAGTTRSFGVDASAVAGLPDGAYEVVATARAGTVVETARAPIDIDRAPPDIHVSTPLARDVWGVRAGTVAGAIHDAHPGEWTVELDGVVIARGAGNADGALARVSAADGEHRLVVRSVDAAANPREEVVSFTVDTMPPVVELLAPAPGERVTARLGTTRLAAQVSDANPRTVSWELRSPAGVRIIDTVAITGSGVVTASWDTGRDPDGAASIAVIVTDAAGHRTEQTAAVIVDNTPPVARIEAPRDARLRDVVVGTVTDAGLDRWTLSIAPGVGSSTIGFVELASGPAPVSSGVLTTFSALPPDGAYTLRLVATDLAGHTREDVATVFVDTTPPGPPVSLVAMLDGSNDVALSWTAPADPDVVGYVVYRGSQRLTAGAIAGMAYRDVAVPDGSWSYVVRAVDAGGLEGAASNHATVTIDASLPVAVISAPREGVTVRGVVEVTGRASARAGLREYRVDVGSGPSPASWERVASGSTAVVSGSLGPLDTTHFAEGATVAVRLQAEDVRGRVSEALRTFVVDNVGPAAPFLVAATLSGADVQVTWTPNAEQDLAGYVLLRNGAPVGSTPGSSFSDLPAYLLPKSSSSYLDVAVPDGMYVYELVALDQAGNVSPTSNARSVTIDRGAPVASVVAPANLARVSGPVTIVAEVAAHDVASVRIEARSRSDQPFVAVGPTLTAYPYAATLDRAAFPGPAIEVRAVATDLGGRTDPSPRSTFFFLGAPPVPPALSATSDGQTVTIAWTDPNPPGSVSGFRVARNGTTLTPGSAILATASATSTASGSAAANALDGLSGTLWTAGGVAPQRWWAELARPTLVSAVSASGVGLLVDGLVRVKGLWVPIERNVPLRGIQMDPPLEIEAVGFDFLAGGGTTPWISEVSFVPAYVGTATTLVETAYSSDYIVEAFTPLGLSSIASVRSRVWAPTLWASTTDTRSAQVRLNGTSGASDVVHVLANGTEIATTIADATSAFAYDATLAPGVTTFQVVATDDRGNRSMLSGSVDVTYTPIPQVSTFLSLAGVDGSTARFEFDAGGDTSAVTAWTVLGVWPDASSSALASVPAGDRAFTAPALSNGTYRIALQPEFPGASGTRSNVVEVIIARPPLPPPTGIAVSVGSGGASLMTNWTYAGPPASEFRVERADAEAGPFWSDGYVQGPPFEDASVVPGTTFYFRVLAIDDAGNPGTPSAVAAGRITTSGPLDAPRITAPATPSRPANVRESPAMISGLAPPWATVELYQDGRWVGETRTSAEGLVRTPIPLSMRVSNGADVALAADVIAYDTTDGSDGAVVVEDLRTGSVTFMRPQGAAIRGAPVLSPDGRRVAVEASSHSDYRTLILVGEVGTGVLRFLDPTDTLAESAPSWSPDSARVAFERWAGTTSIAVADVTAGVSRTVWSDGVDSARAPTWVSTSAVVAMIDPSWSGDLRTVAVFDVPTGARTDLATGHQLATPVAPSPDGRTVVFAGYDDAWGPALRAVDLQTGSVTILATEGVAGGTLAFSPDGGRLALTSTWGNLGMLEMATRQLEWIDSLGHGRLLWTATEGIVLCRPWNGPEIVERGAPFRIATASLSPGDHVFRAVAADEGAGRRSDPSRPVTVTYQTAAAPDLVVSAVVQPTTPVAGAEVTAWVTVRNAGAVASSATDLAARVLASDGSIRTAPVAQVPALAPAASVAIAVKLDVGGLLGPQQLVARVDPRQLTQDADRSNDQVTVDFSVVAAGGVTLAVKPSPIDPGEALTAVVSVFNAGEARDVVVETSLVDAAGTLVATAPSASLTPLSTGAAVTLQRGFATASILAGEYTIVAVARSNGAELARATAPVTIAPEIAVQVSVASARASYRAGEGVSLATDVHNASGNAPVSGAALRVEILGAGGVRVLTLDPRALPFLWLGGTIDVLTDVPAGVLAAGAYEARAVVEVGGSSIAAGTTSFTILPEALLAGALDVSGGGSPLTAKLGAQVTVTATVRNVGTDTTRGALADVVTLAEDGTEVGRIALALGDVAVGSATEHVVMLPTVGLSIGIYGLVLVARYDGRTEALATARFRVADGFPPMLVVQAPVEGAFVRSAVNTLVIAKDDRSGTSTVRVSVDGAPPVALALTAGFPLDGTWSGALPLGADGPHTLVFSAADAEGNDGLTAPSPQNPISLQITSDTAAPSLALAGVVEQACYAIPPTPLIQAADASPVVTYAELDGAQFASGTPVTADGDHTLVAQATDAAGNQATSSVRFVVDGSAPRLGIAGAVDGSFVATSVPYRVTVDDAHLTSMTVALNGAPAAQAATLDVDGAYTLAVHTVDCAGNEADAVVRFTIDRIDPSVAISGVAEGSYVREPVAPTWTASDANLASVVATLDGVPASSGAAIASDGSYLLEVRATDRAGNSTTRSVAFIVDTVDPAVEIAGFVNGSYVASPVYPTYTVRDGNLASDAATLDGIPFVIGLGVTSEGLHVFEVTAIDHAGHRTVRSAHFTIDRSPPRIVLGGFGEGAIVRGPVTPTFAVDDANAGTVTAVLDTRAFAGGEAVVVEGSHALVVHAVDLAGNESDATGHFTIDDTPPRIAFVGVTDGLLTSGAVSPVVVIDDANLATSVVTLDGGAFVSGTSVTGEGDHVLGATAADRAGLSTSATVRFAIDRTPPTITIAGVTEGGSFGSGIAPTIVISDVHPATSSVTLDGAQFVSGTAIVVGGAHVLSAVATDAAGNSSAAQVTFSVGETDPGSCPGPEPVQARLPIFTDTLQNCFDAPAVWGGHDLEHHEVVHEGTTSIAFNPAPWAMLKLVRTGLRSQYAGLEFWINGGANGGQTIVLEVESGRDRVAVDTHVASLLGRPIPAGTWAKVSLPFRFPTHEDEVRIGFKTFDQQGEMAYLDDLVLLASTAGTCCGSRGAGCSDGDVCNGAERCDGAGTCVRGLPLRTNDRNACTVDACDTVAGVSHTPADAGQPCFVENVCGAYGECDGAGTCQHTTTVKDALVYDDVLAACFRDDGGGPKYDPYERTFVHGGANAIRLDLDPWANAAFTGSDLGVSFDGAEFWVYGGAMGQDIGVYATDSAGDLYAGFLVEDLLGHALAPGTWERVRVPFTRASQTDWVVLWLQANDPQEGALYLDDIRLVRTTP